MKIDEIVFSHFYKATFTVRNTSNHVVSIDYWVTTEPEKAKPKDVNGYSLVGEVSLAGYEHKIIFARISNIKPDKLQVYYLCAQEKPSNQNIAVVGKACAKLRLYWPQSELLTP